jgi:hypothetical protein
MGTCFTGHIGTVVADPAKKTKYVVVPGKQDIIEVHGIDDVEGYNQYDEMNLFTDLP